MANKGGLHLDSERELTLADILLAFRRRMKIFWTVFILTVVATGIYLFFIAEPTYEASARVKVQGGGAPRLGLSVESILSGSLFSSSAGLQDEIEILKSRTNIMSVIEKLDLVHKLIDEKDLETALNEGRTMDDMKISLYSTIVDELLVISPVKDSNIIEVKFSCEDPKLASEVVNEIVQNYMNFSEAIAKRQITLRKQFIDEQLPAVEQDLKKAEEALTEFKEETNIYDADTQAKSLLDLMITMSSKLEEAKIQVDMSEKTLEFYTAQLEGLEQDLKDVRDSLTFDPIVLQLKSKLIDLQVEIAGLKETYTESNPTVLEKQRELQETKSQLETEVARIMSSKIRKASNPVYQQVFQNLITGEAQRLVYETQVEAYQKLLDDLQKQLAKLPYLEQRLIGLQREYMAKQTVYQTLVQAQYEALISEAAVTSNSYVLDPAVPPLRPTKPNKKLSLAIGGVLGIFLAILAVFISEASDKRVKSESDAEFYLGKENILSKIPVCKTVKQKEATKKALKTLLNTFDKKIILVTSFEEKAGKSFICRNIAESLSRSETRFVVLTEDPIITSSFESENVADYLNDNVEEKFEHLRRTYDRVIIDAPSLKDEPDVMLLAKKSDAVLIVVKLEHTEVQDLDMLRLLENVDGFILNGLTRTNSQLLR